MASSAIISQVTGYTRHHGLNRGSLITPVLGATLIQGKLNAAVSEAKKKRASKGSSLTLLTVIQTEIRKSLAKAKSQNETDRLEARLTNIAQFIDAVNRDKLVIKGVIGRAASCIQAGVASHKIKANEIGISRHHCIVFECLDRTFGLKNQVFVETLGSAITLFKKSPVEDLIKNPQVFAYEASEKHPPAPISNNGRVHALTSQNIFDSGVFTVQSKNGPRYIVEAPLQQVRVMKFEYVDESLEMDFSKFETFIKDKVALNFRHLVMLKGLEAYDDDVYKSIVHVVLVLAEETVNTLGFILNNLKLVSEFIPDRIDQNNAVMCNNSCTPTINSLYKEFSICDTYFQALYDSHEMTPENQKNTSKNSEKNSGRLYSQGFSDDHYSRLLVNVRKEFSAEFKLWQSGKLSDHSLL
jgi:hypothetical protein